MAEQPIDDTVSAEDLKTLLEQERAKRTEAETRVAVAETRARTAETARTETEKKLSTTAEERYNAQLEAYTGQISAAEAEADRLENEWATLQEAGNFKEAAKIQRRLGEIGGQLDRIKYQKQYMEGQKDAILKAPESKPAADDPLAMFSPATREWIGRHPQFLSDTKYNARVIGYHNLAIAEELKPDTPEYFAYIEKQLGEGYHDTPQPKKSGRDTGVRSDTGADEDIEPETETIQIERERPMATPVTRSAPAGGTRSNGQIKLTADEVEAADMTMPDVPEGDASGYYVDEKGGRQPGRYMRYHQNKLRLKAAGRI